VREIKLTNLRLGEEGKFNTFMEAAQIKLQNGLDFGDSVDTSARSIRANFKRLQHDPYAITVSVSYITQTVFYIFLIKIKTAVF